MKTSTRFQRIVALTVLSLCSVGMASMAQAAGHDSAPQLSVKYADLKVSASPGAEALYRRIAEAAHTVCRPLEDSNLQSLGRHDACVKEAVSAAVSKVDTPALAAIYNAKNPQVVTTARVAFR